MKRAFHNLPARNEDDLIASYIVSDPYRPGIADAILTDSGVPVWALVGAIVLRGDTPDGVAEGYEVPREAVKPYDRRPYMPFRGSVRDEDVVTQATQGLLGERSERLATSDRGVIALRRIAREAVEAVQRGERPKGVLAPERAGDIVRLDTFVGVRPKSPAPQAAPAR